MDPVTNPPDPAVLALTDVSKTYRSNRQTVTALDSVTLTVRPGETVWLRGDSGSGKTTLLSIAGLLTRADFGQVCLAGLDIATVADSRLPKLRRRQVGFIFQSHYLIPWLDAIDNVALAAPQTPADEIVDLLTRLGLAARLSQAARLLSGGEQQRVAVARAVINHPALILADEPVSGLDEAATHAILSILRSLGEAGSAVVIASHQSVVGDYCSRQTGLAHGRMTQALPDSDSREEFGSMTDRQAVGAAGQSPAAGGASTPITMSVRPIDDLGALP
jgi:putative ABC transport system ATP-binding protein